MRDGAYATLHEETYDLAAGIASSSCDEGDLHGEWRRWVSREIAAYAAAAEVPPNEASARGTRQPGGDRVLNALDQSAVVAEQHRDEVV